MLLSLNVSSRLAVVQTSRLLLALLSLATAGDGAHHILL